MVLTFTDVTHAVRRTPQEWHARSIDALRIAERDGYYTQRDGRCGLAAFGGARCDWDGRTVAAVLYRGAAYGACGAHAEVMRVRFLAGGKD